MNIDENTKKFLKSGYDIEGEKYYSFQQIGEFLFPEKWPVDAYNKTRQLYRYRREELKKYSKKTKCWWSGQMIMVLNLEGVKALCGFVKKSESSERLGNLLFPYNFS